VAQAKLPAHTRASITKPARAPSASGRGRAASHADPSVVASTTAAELTKQATDAMFRGELDAARAGFRKALRIDPHHARAWRSLGLLLDSAGEDADAVRALRRYLALRPDAPDAAKVEGRIAAMQAPR
jgi:Flp pilus assembly protein TadD